MKKLFYLLMAAFAVMAVCSSCSKDDEGGEDYAQLIVGTWEMDQRYDVINQVYEQEGATFTFVSDGTGYAVFTDEGYDEIESWHWTISGSTLTIDDGNSQESAKIKKLTKQELVLNHRFTENGQQYEYNMYYSRKR